MLRELRAAILPTQGLAKTITNWNEIAKRLAESKRIRIRQLLK
jgi:hypothetical protein